LSLIGDAETKKYIKDKKKCEQEIERLNKRQTEIEQELEHLNELKRTLSSRLLDLKGAGELQKRRDELEQQAKLIREQLKQANEIIRREISTRGYTVLLSETLLKFREQFEQLREKGELQTGITQQFIKDLLHQQHCICGTELTAGTPNREQVESWLGKAGVADIEETAIRMSTQVDEIEKRVPEFWEKVDQQQANLNQNRAELSRLETQLDDVKKKLRSYPDEDIQQLQKRLDEVEAKINHLNRETGSNQQQIETANGSVSQLEKQIDKQKMNEMKQVIAQRRIEKTQESIHCLTQIKDRLDQQFRWQLESRVQNIFSRISFTPYLPKLNEQYELKLIETTAGDEAEVAASTGENQILSLSFIGGIIEGVREWSQKNTLMGPDSSTFPIVMDSPFGSLDEIYRRQIAKIIPELANQLVVLVTKTQWRGEVAQEMEKRIGKEYVLSYNSPKTDCEEDFIESGRVRYPLVKHSPNAFEYTEILEVTDDF
jgi:DNA sulfur modification protein DndD